MRFHLVYATLFAFAVSGQAGIRIVEKSEPAGQGEPTSSNVLIDSNRLRVESSSPQGQHIFIYRPDREMMYMIEPGKKSYREMSKQDLEQMMNQLGDQMGKMKEMMDEQMKNMSPEQRQMLERMMKGKMSAMMGTTAKTVYRKASSGERVREWTCDKYEGTRGNEKVQEVWTTDWKQFGLTASDFQVLQELAGFFQSLASRMQADFFYVGAANAETEGGFSGVPVRRITYRNGKPYEKHEVTEVSRQDFPDSLFQVPDGYKKLDSPWKNEFKQQ